MSVNKEALLWNILGDLVIIHLSKGRSNCLEDAPSHQHDGDGRQEQTGNLGDSLGSSTPQQPGDWLSKPENDSCQGDVAHGGGGRDYSAVGIGEQNACGQNSGTSN